MGLTVVRCYVCKQFTPFDKETPVIRISSNKAKYVCPKCYRKFKFDKEKGYHVLRKKQNEN